MKRRRRKITYKRAIIIGFAALYFTSMLLSTYLIKEKYEEGYNTKLYEVQDNLYEALFTAEDYLVKEKARDQLKKFALAQVSSLYSSDPFQQFSAALFHRDGELLAVTSEMFGEPIEVEGDAGRKTEYYYFKMEDYLTEEKMQELSRYYDSDSGLMKEMMETLEETNVMIMYLLCADYDKEAKEPAGLYMMERHVGFENEWPFNDYNKLFPDPVWTWKNQDFESDVSNIVFPIDGSSNTIVQFPYIAHGTKAWERWRQDEWLQSLVDYDIKVKQDEQIEKGGLRMQSSQMVAVAGQNDGFCKLIIRQTAHPWLAAMDYMKYVYLMGVILTIACIIKVIYSTNKTYKEREQLETMRRDFTNAAAHELKTPLSVIRGFAENLKENTVEEKKDYYLDQIILQTEQIDELVKQMIQVAKMDTEQLASNNEDIAMTELIKGQMEKLDFLVEEKDLKVIYEIEDEFALNGNRIQLEKMIWNLLSNAVEYNRQAGKILIHVGKNRIAIENSGEAIPQEKLDRIFDMFYTGDESRHERSKHMGLGLYLSKRICDAHGLKLVVCNTDAGVRAAIHR